MLEIWVGKARGGLAGHGSRSFRWLRVLPPGAWIIITVAALVGGRLYWLKSQRPEHLQEIAAAYGSISMLNREAQFNHDLSQFIYVAATQTRGVGLYLCDTATKHKRLVDVEKDGSGYWHDDFDLQAWPWSPDDSAFIYTMQGKLFICPTDTNRAMVQFNLASNAIASGFIWLNPLEFAWLEGETICQARRSLNGPWTVQRLPHQGQIVNLTAVGPHSIAWLQEGFICRLDLSHDLTGTNNPFAVLNQYTFAAPATNDLVLWLDTSVLRLTNNAPVKSLPDLSAKGNHATVDNSAPIFNAPGSSNALNGRGTIHFESGQSLLDGTGLRTNRRLGIKDNEPRSAFAVMRRVNGRKMLVNLGAPEEVGTYFGLCDQSDALYLPAGWASADSRFRPLHPQWNILEATYDGGSQSSYVNGYCRGTKAVSLKTSDRAVEIGWRSGSRSMKDSVSSDGDFAELLIYDRVLSYAEQRQLEDYLSAKWFGSRPLSSDSPLVWLDPKTNCLTGFCYSRNTGQLLFTRSDNGQDTLLRLDTEMGAIAETSPIFSGRFLRNVQWIGKREYAYISRENGRRGLVFADLSGKQNDPLFPHGDISWFRVTPDQKRILLFANLSNEPAPGIWQYDLASEQLASVIPGTDHPSSFAKKVHPYTGFIKLPSGRSINCTIYPPANFDRHKRYPLVIGDTLVSDPIHGSWLQSGIAACGAYIVFVDRKSWYGEIADWEANVRAVYDYLRQDPSIDPKQVYLFGASAETQFMSECLEKTPSFWQGAIYLNPSTLPAFSEPPLFQLRPKILISAGSEEPGILRFKCFQQEALQAGSQVETIIHPTETHRIVGAAAKLERLQAIQRFIFEE